MSDEFESKLQRQSPRELPGAWRADILATARSVQSSSSPTEDGRPKLAAFIKSLLWPHPAAWAGLAAVWLVILAMDFSASDRQAQTVVRNDAPPSPDMIMVLNRQNLWESELIGQDDLPTADRPKAVVPRPRSERRVEIRNV